MGIAKLLSVGDEVYSAANGEPMKVTRMYGTGFVAGGDITVLRKCVNCIF